MAAASPGLSVRSLGLAALCGQEKDWIFFSYSQADLEMAEVMITPLWGIQCELQNSHTSLDEYFAVLVNV